MNIDAQSKHRLEQVFRIGLERADEMLQTICNSPIKLELKSLYFLSPQDFHSILIRKVGSDSISAMELVFTGQFEGITQLIFPPSSVTTLISLIESEDRRKLDKQSSGKAILSEVGNIFYNGVMGVISTLSEYGITYMIPKYKEGSIQRILLSSRAAHYSTSLLGSVEFYPEKKLIFGFHFSAIEPLLEESKHLGDYFSN